MFFGLGIIILLYSVFLIFGLKETYSNEKTLEDPKILRTAFEQLWVHKSLILGVVGFCAVNMTYLAFIVFATLVYQDEYTDTDQSKSYISSKLATLYLVSMLLTIPLSIVLGYVCDRIYVWKVLAVETSLIIFSLLLFIAYSP